MAQYKRVMQGKQTSKEGVYISTWPTNDVKFDEAVRSLDEARRLSYKERRVNA